MGHRADGVDAQLAQKANYRQENNVTSPNLLQGFIGNDVASNLYAVTISGGGTLGSENIVGGNTTNVGTETPNIADLPTTNANFAVIGGGYDNVNNALAGVLTGFHCIIEALATHGTISGGSFHKITDGDYPTIAGGTLNQASGNYSVIGGGTSNKVTAPSSTVGGGISNEANGDSSTVSGGYLNKIVLGVGANIAGGSQNTMNANFGTIGGGNSNVVNGSGGCVTGGHINTVNNPDGAILGGNLNIVNADYASVLGGKSNVADEKYSTVQGFEGISKIVGQQVLANGKFLTVGDAQLSRVVLKKQSTNATETSLLTPEFTFPTLQPNESVAFTCTVISRRIDVAGESKYFEIKGMATKDGAGNVTILSGTPVTLGTPTWSIRLWGNVTNFYIGATGEAEKTIQWVAKLEFIENVG